MKRRRTRSGGKKSSRNRPIRNASIGAIAIFCAAAIIIAASSYFRSEADNAQPVSPQKPIPVSLRLNGPLGSKYAGEIVAARFGLFERAGLNVDIKPGDPTQDTIASVVSGKDTFGVTDSIGFLRARADGQPIVAIAANYLEHSIVFYALEKSGIRSPQDFVGKRVGRRPNTDSAILYDALLKQVGLSRSQVRETATEADIDALLNDKVDVIPGRVGREAYLLRQKNIPFSTIKISDYGLHIPDTVYFTTEKFALGRPSVVERLLQAIIAGWTMTYTDPIKAIPKIVAASKDIAPEQTYFELAAQRDFVMPLGRRVAEFDDQQWKQLLAILTSARLMDGSVDLGRAVNYDILKEAYRRPISFGN